MSGRAYMVLRFIAFVAAKDGRTKPKWRVCRFEGLLTHGKHPSVGSIRTIAGVQYVCIKALRDLRGMTFYFQPRDVTRGIKGVGPCFPFKSRQTFEDLEGELAELGYHVRIELSSCREEDLGPYKYVLPKRK